MIHSVKRHRHLTREYCLLTMIYRERDREKETEREEDQERTSLQYRKL